MKVAKILKPKFNDPAIGRAYYKDKGTALVRFGNNSVKKTTQAEIIMEFFRNHPKKNIKHPEIVDWATAEYKRITGEIFRDPDRQIRRLHQEGLLIKIAKGVYKYDPEITCSKNLENFSTKQKEQILERDEFRCVICGKGKHDGIELHVDHIKPKDMEGRAILANGQTLCATHNFRKKNYKQTEIGKKMFIRLYESAKAANDTSIMDLCSQLLDVYEKNDVDGHIKWKKEQ